MNNYEDTPYITTLENVRAKKQAMLENKISTEVYNASAGAFLADTQAAMDSSRQIRLNKNLAASVLRMMVDMEISIVDNDFGNKLHALVMEELSTLK